MVICKYFAEGRCRFGSQCFNEHIPDNRYRHGDQYANQQSYNSSNRYDQNVKDNRQHRYQDNYAQSRSYDQNKYSWRAPVSSHEHQSSQYDSSYNHRPPRYDDSSQYGSSYDHRPSQYDSSSRSPLSQNFERSSSPQYNSPPSQPFRNDRNRQSRQDSSFSWPVHTDQSDRYQSKGSGFPSSKNRYENLKDSRLDKENISEQNEIVESVKKDMAGWDKGGQWPFSCYLPFTGCVEFPGFSDISPEELRHEAYEAEKNGSFPTYVKSISEAMDIVKEKRELLRNPTSETVKLIMDVSNQKSNIDSNQKQAVHFGTGFSTENSAAAFKNQSSGVLFGKSTFGSSSGGGFSLRHLAGQAPQASENLNETQMTDNLKSAAPQSVFRLVLPQKSSDFSFKLPSAEASSKPSSKGADSSLYMSLEELTSEEKEAYEAPVFMLGKIPTRPPAAVFCF